MSKKPILSKSQAAAVGAIGVDSTPTATKAIRKASRKPQQRLSLDDRIAAAVAAAVPSIIAAMTPQAAAVAVVIPPHVQAMVDKEIISQEQALAIASDPSLRPQQQAAADSIPSPVLVAEIHKHKPACVKVIGKGKDANECFDFPIATRPATGQDYHDRVTLGYHKVKSFLMVVKAAEAYCEAQELKRGK